MGQHLRVESTPWIAGRLIIGDGSLGVLGADIPVTGEAGGSIFANDFQIGDEGKEFRALVTTPPAAGQLFVFDDGSIQFDAPGSGAYSFQYQLYVDGVATGAVKTVSLTAGIPVAAMAATLAAATFVGAGAGAGASSGVLAATLSPATFAAFGAGANPGTIVGTITANLGDATFVATGAGFTPFPYAEMLITLDAATMAAAGDGFSPTQYAAASRSWDEMVRIIAVDVAECPDFVIVEKLKLAAREFCIKSWSWREDLRAIQTVADIDEYTLPVPDGAVVVQILSAAYGGAALAPGSIEGLEELYGDLATLDAGLPAHFAAPHVGAIALVPRPAVPGSLVVKAALTPSFTATGLPDWLIDRWGETIMAKARALLFSMPDRAWTDSVEAGNYDKQFSSSTGNAKARASKSNTRTRSANRARFF